MNAIQEHGFPIFQRSPGHFDVLPVHYDARNVDPPRNFERQTGGGTQQADHQEDHATEGHKEVLALSLVGRFKCAGTERCEDEYCVKNQER